MKRPLARAEWWLIGSPALALGIFALVYARWQAVAPATLGSAPIPLEALSVPSDGQLLVAMGTEIDASNNRVPGKPSQFFRWNARDGKLVGQMSEFRPFWSWTTSPDGKQVALYQTSFLTRSPQQNVIVRNLSNGDDISSWPVVDNGFNSAGIFSPDGRELLLYGYKLERRDVTTGRVLGVLDASKVFPNPKQTSSFERIRFPPDGHLLALIEGVKLTGDSYYIKGTTASTSSFMGGRLAIYTFPALKPVMKAQGDSYSDCDWKSNSRLWAIAPVVGDYSPLKLVRAHIDVPQKQTQLQALDLPDLNTSSRNAWDRSSLYINGATAQVLLVARQSLETKVAYVWGSDGRVETNFRLALHTAAQNGRAYPSDYAPLRFSQDGRSLFRLNERNIERYDLGRYLPASASKTQP